jgi:hypothetical protein
MESETNAIKFSLRLDPRIYAALEREGWANGRDIGDHMQRVFTDHVITSGLLDEAVAAEYTMRQSLIDRVGETARGIIRTDGFSRDIINKSIDACIANPVWIADYSTFVGGDPFIRANPQKSSINREFGSNIRKTIGGRVAKSSTNKPITTVVKGSIIQRYTELEGLEGDDL